MSRRLDIGIASYEAPEKLALTLASLRENSRTDCRFLVIHNPSPEDNPTREVICGAAAADPRVVPVWLEANEGYAGAVAKLMELAETEYIAYCDNDAVIVTAGWDEKLCGYLDRFHEIGIIFPGGGAYGIPRGNYTEVMWGVGFCWVLSRLAMVDAGPFDTTLGHQEEADYCLRVRMAGYKCAAAPDVFVSHDATATNDPASNERISRGVINWVNKWNRYFNGKQFNYHSPNVTRWEDWPPNALYLEEYWGRQLPELNAAPETVRLDGREYDLIKVPRLAGFYRNRII